MVAAAAPHETSFIYLQPHLNLEPLWGFNVRRPQSWLAKLEQRSARLERQRQHYILNLTSTLRHISGVCTLWDKRAEARRRLSPIAGEMWYLYARCCIFMQMITISEQRLWNMQLTAAYLAVLLPLLWAARVADTAGYIKNSLSHSPLTTWEEMNVTSLELALFHRIWIISF